VGQLRIEHDDQVSEGACTGCGAPYQSVIGLIYEDDDAIAIYRADIFEHFHRDPEPRVVLSIAVGDWRDGTNRSDRCSASIEAWTVGNMVQMAFSDRVGSSWAELEVVSWQLTSLEAQAGPLRDAFLRLADNIAYKDRRLRRALSAKTTTPT